jgi:predicted MFS family arabinose efflux permease
MSSKTPGPPAPKDWPSWVPSVIRQDHLWSHRDFVRLWSGRAISQFGTQVSLVAIPLYAVLALDAGPLQMGLLAAGAGIPRLLLGLVAGAWVDRLRRKPIMLATDLGRALTMAIIPLAALLGMASLELLIAVEVIMGLLTVVYQAAWVPYLPGLIGRGHLASANSKMIASNSVAQVAGPSLAGTLVGVLGAPVTFVLDAASYLWSALFISRIEHSEELPTVTTTQRSLYREVRYGIRVLLMSPLLRALTGSHATIILAGHLFLAIYPLYMLNTLGLSAKGVGLVYAAGGIGGLVGSLITSATLRRAGTGPTIVWSAVLFGMFGVAIPLAVLVPAYALPLVLFAEFAQWMVLVIFQIAEGSLRQAVTPNHLLGRVAASDQVLANGLQPIGAFVGGVLGQVFGVQEALLIGVGGMFCAGAWVYWSPVREIGAMPTEPDPTLDASANGRAAGELIGV